MSEFHTGSDFIQKVPVEVMVMNRYGPIQEEGTERLQEPEVRHIYSKKQYFPETTGLSHVWAHSSCDCLHKTCTESHQPELQPRWGEELRESHPLAKEQLAIDGCSRGQVFFRDTAQERQCVLHHVQAAFVGLSGFLEKCTWSWVQKVVGGFKKELEKRVWWVDLIKMHYMHCEIFK